MIAKIGKMLTKKEDKPFSYEELATMLKTSPDALKTFEDAYKRQVLDSGALSENFLQWDTATVKAMLDKRVPFTRDLETLIDRIVGELTDGTRLYIYNEKRGGYYVNYAASRYTVPITNNDLKKYPEELRPQLTGNLVKVDISEPSYKILLQNYAEYKDARDDRMKKFYYNKFRQGLDILDLDDFTYQMLEMNPNTMGFWLPPLAKVDEYRTNLVNEMMRRYPSFEEPNQTWLPNHRNGKVILENKLFYIIVEDNEWAEAVELIQKESEYGDVDLSGLQKQHYRHYLDAIQDILLEQFGEVGIYTGPWTSGKITKGESNGSQCGTKGAA